MQKLSEEVEKLSGYNGLRVIAAKCSDCWKDSTALCEGRAGAEIEVVEDFCYLGSHISNNGNSDKECSTRFGKASSVFDRLTGYLEEQGYKSDDKSQTKGIARFFNVTV